MPQNVKTLVRSPRGTAAVGSVATPTMPSAFCTRDIPRIVLVGQLVTRTSHPPPPPSHPARPAARLETTNSRIIRQHQGRKGVCDAD